MPRRRFPLNKFPELLKNPPPNVDIMLYDKKKEGPYPSGNTMNNSNEEKMTLTKLAKIVVDGFERVNTRINNLEKDVKDINVHLDGIDIRLNDIDARLDYNGLKDLPKSK